MSAHEGSKWQEEQEAKERLNKQSSEKIKQTKYIPPDHGDVCWEIGSKTFTRKQVLDILHTQRAMITNDLKTNCGNQLTKDMFDILNNPRTPNI